MEKLKERNKNYKYCERKFHCATTSGSFYAFKRFMCLMFCGMAQYLNTELQLSWYLLVLLLNWLTAKWLFSKYELCRCVQSTLITIVFFYSCLNSSLNQQHIEENLETTGCCNVSQNEQDGFQLYCIKEQLHKCGSFWTPPCWFSAQ